MDKYERRRLALLRIKDERCDSNVASLARFLEKDATYVHRMLYPDDKAGRKRIGEDSVDKVKEVFNIDLDAGGEKDDAESRLGRQLQWVDDEESELLTMFRATDAAGRATLLAEAMELPRVLFDEIANHKPKGGA